MDALRPYTPVYSGANPSVDEDMSDSFLITNAAWMAKNDEDADEDADTDMCCTPVGSSVTSSHPKSPERDPPRAPTRRMGGWGRQTTWKLEKRNSLFDAKVRMHTHTLSHKHEIPACGGNMRVFSLLNNASKALFVRDA